MQVSRPFGLFEVCGIEIEYMIVDRHTRNVRSIVKNVLDQLAEDNAAEDSLTGDIEWSNELVAHVLEAKCHCPIKAPETMWYPLREGIAQINELLQLESAFLMPSAAHPWMDPKRDADLYPQDEECIYREYDRIFGCHTHGWTNLQSVHINLPFADAEEFGRLHSAIRVILPLIPSLSAASPYLDGVYTGMLDARMEYYRTNSLRIPFMTGDLIPEPVFTPQAYKREILDHLYEVIAPLDPKGVLHNEWANARGAIARFERNAIEIRVMDSQECPLADLGIAHAVIMVTKLLAEERFASLATLQQWDTHILRNIFFAGIRDAEQTQIPSDYAALFGISGSKNTFRDVWATLFTFSEMQHPLFSPVYERYLEHGPLARRLLRQYGTHPSHADLISLVDVMGQCLREDRLFV